MSLKAITFSGVLAVNQFEVCNPCKDFASFSVTLLDAMDSTNQNLHVIIVGCGIAGLAASRFLREHHDVTIYERAGADAATGGHGISLFPNSVKLLDNIGFDRERAGAVVCGGYRSYTKTGKMKTDVKVDFLDRYGANSLTMKRSDFRDELYRLGTAPAIELGIAVNDVKTVFHNGAVDLNPETGEVTLADGSKDVGDVVIGSLQFPFVSRL